MPKISVTASLIAKLWLDALREDQPLNDWALTRLGKALTIRGGEAPKRLMTSPGCAPYVVVDVAHGQIGTRLEDYLFVLRVGLGVSVDEPEGEESPPDAVHEAFRLLDAEFAEEVLDVLTAASPDLEFVHVAYVYEDAFDPLFCLDLEITVLVPKTLAADIVLNP